MATIIKSAAFIRPYFLFGILEITTRAAKLCLKNAGIDIDDVGILIHTGVYTENHLSEPALAALIQNQLQKNHKKAKLTEEERSPLFSFDLHNGGGGLINAIQVIDGFIQSGKIIYGLVIAGDNKPRLGRKRNFHYSPSAGAILLAKDDGNSGFAHFKTETYTEFAGDFVSAIQWKTGKFCFKIDHKENYLENCVDCSVKAIRQFLIKEKIEPGEIDLIITSQSPAGFIRDLQKKLSFGNVLNLTRKGRIYTSGLLSSLSKVFYNGKFNVAKNILFVTVGAGITVSVSLYINQ